MIKPFCQFYPRIPTFSPKGRKSKDIRVQNLTAYVNNIKGLGERCPEASRSTGRTLLPGNRAGSIAERSAIRID